MGLTPLPLEAAAHLLAPPPLVTSRVQSWAHCQLGVPPVHPAPSTPASGLLPTGLCSLTQGGHLGPLRLSNYNLFSCKTFKHVGSWADAAAHTQGSNLAAFSFALGVL